jgi:hypothetical protein
VGAVDAWKFDATRLFGSCKLDDLVAKVVVGANSGKKIFIFCDVSQYGRCGVGRSV